MPRATSFWPPVLLFVATTWAAAPILTWAQDELGWPTFVVRLTSLAPALGALAVVLVFGERLTWPVTGTTRWRTRLFLAVEMAVAVFFLVWFFVFISRQPFPTIRALELTVPLAGLLAIALVMAVAQESGWRGTLQPLLERRWNPFWAALVTGLTWGLGRVEYAAITLTHYAMQLVGAVGLSLVLAAATMGLRRRDRTIVAATVQWLIGAALLVWFAGGDISIGWLTYTAIAFAASGTACIPLLLGRAQREHERTTAFD